MFVGNFKKNNPGATLLEGVTTEDMTKNQKKKLKRKMKKELAKDDDEEPTQDGSVTVREDKSKMQSRTQSTYE